MRPDAIWLELSEEVRLEDLADAITLENLTLGGQELPVELSQPVLEGRNAGRRVAVWADLPDTAPDGQPTWPPRPGEQIRLALEGSGLIDVWGNVGVAGEQRTWQWAGGDVVLADTAAPRVLRVCVTVDGRIEIELSEPVDAATLGAISVDGQAVAWTISSTGYLLTSGPLAAGSRALVIGTALEDLVGTALAQQWSSSVEVVEGEPSLAWAAPWPGAVEESSVGNQLGFHGLPHDPATGLVYARNRDYDPEMGRFIQTDPLGYVDSVSLYQYGLNNPVNFSDPTGEAVGLLTLGIDAAFAAYDTYQLATGEIGWGEYGTRMALTGASVGAELLSAGTGGGLLVKAARLGGRTGKAAKATFNTIRWVNRGDIAYNAAQAGLSGYLAFEEGEFGRVAISAAQAAVTASGIGGHRAGPRSRNFTGNAFARNPWTPVRQITSKAVSAMNPLSYTTSRVKGLLGRELAAARARLRGEQILGREVSMRVGGFGLRADLVTRSRSGTLRVIEAKFGRFSQLTENQADAFPILRATGKAEFYGPRATKALRKAGITVGDGIELEDVDLLLETFGSSRVR